MLRIENVSVTFGGLTALSRVALEAAAGQVTGLIGPNGAGKTTLFNVIAGLQRTNGGTIWLDGKDITSASARRRAQLGLGRTFQRLELFGSLSVRDNVLVALEARTSWSRRAGRLARAEELLDRVGLTIAADTRADVLPTGSARLLEVARALAAEPRVLLLDEASSGLDGTETANFAELVRRLAGEGTAVLLVEHDMELVMGVCDHIHVLDFGQLIAAGEPAQIRQDSRVQAAYLGTEPVDARPPTGKLGRAS